MKQLMKYTIVSRRLAVAAHAAYTEHVMAGHGVDRHFLGLRMIAKEVRFSVFLGNQYS